MNNLFSTFKKVIMIYLIANASRRPSSAYILQVSKRYVNFIHLNTKNNDYKLIDSNGIHDSYRFSSSTSKTTATPLSSRLNMLRETLGQIDEDDLHDENTQKINGSEDEKDDDYSSFYFEDKDTDKPLMEEIIEPKKQKTYKTSEENRADVLIQRKQEELKEEMINLNNGIKFNPNSPQQVRNVLYGEEDMESGMKLRTDKDSLEAMASGGNKMADLILQYRKCTSQIRYIKKTESMRQNGLNYPAVVSNSATTNSKVHSIVDVDPLLLVDASACIFRAYHSMPPLHRSDGTPVGAVLGVCNILNRLLMPTWIQGHNSRIVLCFDSSSSKSTFRHELYPKYKSNRPPCPIDLVPQFELIKEAAHAYGIPIIEAPIGYEADDVIATLATTAQGNLFMNVHILSADKDLMQLVTKSSDSSATSFLHNVDENHSYITMVDPFTNKRYTYSEVMNKFHGIRPTQLGDVLALAGDSSDNVPGVPGIGIKIASNLIMEFDNLDNLLNNHLTGTSIPQKKRLQQLIEYQSQAKLSRELVDLKKNIPLHELEIPSQEYIKDNLRIKPLHRERLLSFYNSMGFQDLKSRTIQRLDYGGKGKSVPFSSGKEKVLNEKKVLEEVDIKELPF